VSPRRIGSAWRRYAELESLMTESDRASVWDSLSRVYPELQDWVARRGHGGAARWSDEQAPQRIAELAAMADVVIVQLHSGFQFQRAPSSTVRRIARQAIDAGATIVICHHPHVLQGIEWYRERLVVYSLGNFIFDQDFLATFDSAMLRTVWEGSQLLEAKVLPLQLQAYRPSPVSDTAARRLLLDVWEMSVAATESTRGEDKTVRPYRATRDEETRPAQLRLERHAAVISKAAPDEQEREIELAAGVSRSLSLDGLVSNSVELHDSCAGPSAALLLGRDLFGWGHFEDALADNERQHGAHWVLATGRKEAIVGKDAARGTGYLRLTRNAKSKGVVAARPIARVPLVHHRLFAPAAEQEAAGRPLDPEPRYSVWLVGRLRGGGAPSIRLDLYAFDDTDPTEAPTSIRIARHELALPLKPNGRWQKVEVDIPAGALSVGSERANMMMPYLRLGVPERETSTLDIDDFSIVEWRAARGMPSGYGHHQLIRYEGEGRCRARVRFLPATVRQ
jgi:hypothetical protein